MYLVEYHRTPYHCTTPLCLRQPVVALKILRCRASPTPTASKPQPLDCGHYRRSIISVQSRISLRPPAPALDHPAMPNRHASHVHCTAAIPFPGAAVAAELPPLQSLPPSRHLTLTIAKVFLFPKGLCAGIRILRAGIPILLESFVSV